MGTAVKDTGMNLEKFSKRRREMLDLSSELLDCTSSWVKYSIDETNVTNRFALIDLLQFRRGLDFPDYALDKLEGRKPIGHVRLQLPQNSPGVALGVGFAAAYINSNPIDIRFSSGQKKLADLVSQAIIDTRLDNVSVVRGMEPVEFVTKSLSGGYDALHFFGHDRHISKWDQAVKESVENGYLKLFVAEGPGKDFFIVLSDADIKKAAKEYVIASTLSSGQICMSPEGAFVHESVIDDFIAGIQDYAVNLTVGNPYDSRTDVGPLMSENVYNRAQGLLEDAVVKGAERKPLTVKFTEDYEDWKENTVVPHLLVISDKESKILHEESFCPEIVVVPYSELNEVMAHLDSMKYGLSSSVYGNEQLQEVVDELSSRMGMIYQNNPFYSAFNVHTMGWGGFKNSGWVTKMDAKGKAETTHGPKYMPELLSMPR